MKKSTNCELLKYINKPAQAYQKRLIILPVACLVDLAHEIAEIRHSLFYAENYENFGEAPINHAAAPMLVLCTQMSCQRRNSDAARQRV